MVSYGIRMKKRVTPSKPAIGKNALPSDVVGEETMTEEALLRKDGAFHALAESLPVGVFLVKNGRLIYSNQKLAEIHGYAVDDMVGKKTTKDLVYSEDIPQLEKHIMNRLSGGSSLGVIEFRGITKRGQIIYLENHGCRFMTSGDQPIMIGIVVDTTERKRTEDELEKYRDHLEQLVEERTLQLAEVNKRLNQDVEKRKRVEEELQNKSRNLEELNTALRVLLKQRENDRKELEEKISSNARELVLRYVRMLKDSRLDQNQRLLVEIIDKNLDEFLSPFCKKITTFDFTPREMEVILLTKEGKTAKEMARLLNVTRDAVNRHRYHVRKKLGLNNNGRNLRSHLMSLS